MGREEAISRDLETLGGTPVFAGTRVPVQALIDYLKAGDSLDDILEGFPSVSREQAGAFLHIVEDNAFAEAIREGQQTEQVGRHELFGERDRHESLHDARDMWKDLTTCPTSRRYAGSSTSVASRRRVVVRGRAAAYRH